jgi:hypothetical protein
LIIGLRRRGGRKRKRRNLKRLIGAVRSIMHLVYSVIK